MRDKRGFSFIEAIVAIIIITITMVFAVNIKTVVFKKATIKEGMKLIEKIDVQTKLYRAQNDTFPTTSRVGSLSKININASNNRYFKEFDISYASGNNFTVNVYGSDKANGVTMNAVISSTTSMRQNLKRGQVTIYGL